MLWTLKLILFLITRAKRVWSPVAYRKAYKKKYSLESAAVHVHQIFASWTPRNLVQNVPQYRFTAIDLAAGGCWSTHTHTYAYARTMAVTLVITNNHIKMPKEEKGQIILLQQETGWGSYQLKSLWVFMCHVTTQTSICLLAMELKQRNWTHLSDKDSNFMEGLTHIMRQSNSGYWPYL